MQHNINDYMTPSEAAYRFGINPDTLKSKLQPKTSNVVKEHLDSLLERGLIKYFIKPNGQRKEWIISKSAILEWFEDAKEINQ
ncbi:TPA: DNA-binding protein [Bacillus pacificus]|nr:DNA-binding protein [Bacillus pacificus]